MLDKVREYFEREYADCVRALERKYCWDSPQGFVKRAIINCLSVAQFSQTIGVKFEEVDPLYMEFKEKLENLLTK